jgi:hypothetical protein
MIAWPSVSRKIGNILPYSYDRFRIFQESCAMLSVTAARWRRTLASLLTEGLFSALALWGLYKIASNMPVSTRPTRSA